MLESVQQLLGDFFGVSNVEQDVRRREYGGLDAIRSRRLASPSTGSRASRPVRKRKRARLSNANLDRSPAQKVRKPPTGQEAQTSTVSRLMTSIKSIFGNDDEDTLRRASNNLNVLSSNILKNTYRKDDYESIKQRIRSSEAFKRKLLDMRYDEKLLNELRQTSNEKNHQTSPKRSLVDDQVFLLQRKLQKSKEKVKELSDELYVAKSKLKFAQEKCTLLEALLNDSNIDIDYMRSRRNIKNLEKENLKPSTELPPSPKRTVHPLVTSSPVNKRSFVGEDKNTKEIDDMEEFYKKYRSLPQTETLGHGEENRSLSPIRIDYSKYSNVE